SAMSAIPAGIETKNATSWNQPRSRGFDGRRGFTESTIERTAGTRASQVGPDDDVRAGAWCLASGKRDGFAWEGFGSAGERDGCAERRDESDYGDGCEAGAGAVAEERDAEDRRNDGFDGEHERGGRGDRSALECGSEQEHAKDPVRRQAERNGIDQQARRLRRNLQDAGGDAGARPGESRAQRKPNTCFSVVEPGAENSRSGHDDDTADEDPLAGRAEQGRALGPRRDCKQREPEHQHDQRDAFVAEQANAERDRRGDRGNADAGGNRRLDNEQRQRAQRNDRRNKAEEIKGEAADI